MNETSNEETSSTYEDSPEFYYRLCVGVFLTLFLTFLNQPKRKKCCCRYCGIIMYSPVKFFEDKENRLAIISIFTLLALELLEMLFNNNESDGYNPIEKLLYQLVMSPALCVTYLPLIITITSCNTLLHPITGFLYSLFLITVELLTYLIPGKDREITDEWDFPVLLVFSSLSISACVVLLFKYVQKLDVPGKTHKNRSCKLSKSSYQVTYVRNLLNLDSLKDSTAQENFFSKHIYKNVKGFRYSLTIQLSVYVGSIVVVLFSLWSYYEFIDDYKWLMENHGSIFKLLNLKKREDATKVIIFAAKKLFRVKPERAEEIEKKVRKLTTSDIIKQQIHVIYGSIFTSLAVSVLVTFITIFHMLKCYRQNVLDMQRRIRNKYVLHTDELRVSNISIIVNSVKFGGYQAAHIIWGFVIQCFVFFLFLVIVSELTIVPLTICPFEFLLVVLEFLGPIVIVMLVTGLGQMLLVKYFFVLEKGKVLALDNRRWFYTFMYSMFYFNALSGLVTCVFRILKSIVFSVLFIPRLDRSVFPNTFEKFDGGFKAYSCLLKMEAVQNNSILVVFLAITNARIRAIKKNSFETENRKEHFLRRLAIRNRWFIIWTLMHNESLIHERKRKSEIFTIS